MASGVEVALTSAEYAEDVVNLGQRTCIARALRQIKRLARELERLVRFAAVVSDQAPVGI